MLKRLLRSLTKSKRSEDLETKTQGRHGKTSSQTMTLEERMAWRREMVYQSVREHLLALEVLSSMYRFRIMPLDPRHHRFAVMIETATGFLPKRAGMALSWAEVERHLQERTLLRYGVVLEAVYWRLDHTRESFLENQRRHTDKANSRSSHNRMPEKNHQNLARNHYDPITPEERRLFEEAIKKGMRPPAVHIGERSYQSDLAPLESDASSGLTRYGAL